MIRKQFIWLALLASSALLFGCVGPQAPGADIKAAADVGTGPAFEAEKMGRWGGNLVKPAGQSGDGIDGPFHGVVLFGNGDFVEVDYNFATPGRYAFEIRGASSDGSMAGVTVFVQDVGGTTVFFEDQNGESKIAMADIEKPGMQKIKLQLMTDVGENDTLLDAFVVSRHSDLPGPPVPPAKGAFETGVYRNLLVERGFDAEMVEKRLARAYDLLFHGNVDEQTLLFPAGSNENGPMAYIADIASGDVRSEGMSYGMMIALQMDKQEDFNAMWNWSRTYMYQDDPNHPCYGYFAWQMNENGTPMDEMPAPDGEEYFIMSLYFASHRWGDGEGIYNYKKEASELLDKFKNRKDIIGKSTNKWGTREITGVALMNPEHKMVRFTPDKTNFDINGDHTNPSYHLPSFYELWALWGPEKDRVFWKEAAEVSRAYFHKSTHPETGLAPDYANFDGTPVSASFNKGSNTFRWDAWRTAMNWAMDYAWWAKDEGQKELSDRIQAFFEGQGMMDYRSCYTLSGGPAEGENGKWHSIGLVAVNGVASLAATHKRGWSFVDGLWGLPVPTGKYRYYDGMLLMFGLLHASGNFKIYMPGHHEQVAAEQAAAEQAAAEQASGATAETGAVGQEGAETGEAGDATAPADAESAEAADGAAGADEEAAEAAEQAAKDEKKAAKDEKKAAKDEKKAAKDEKKAAKDEKKAAKDEKKAAKDEKKAATGEKKAAKDEKKGAAGKKAKAPEAESN